MRRLLYFIITLIMLFMLMACAMDTPVTLSGLKYEKVCKWTVDDWQKATTDERIEALYLIIDEADENVDAGLSAIASLEGFNEAFENAADDTTLLEIFSTCSADEVTAKDNN